jgi:hypothetical protein
VASQVLMLRSDPAGDAGRAARPLRAGRDSIPAPCQRAPRGRAHPGRRKHAGPAGVGGAPGDGASGGRQRYGQPGWVRPRGLRGADAGYGLRVGGRGLEAGDRGKVLYCKTNVRMAVKNG